jgi:hypothetical protein
MARAVTFLSDIPLNVSSEFTVIFAGKTQKIGKTAQLGPIRTTELMHTQWTNSAERARHILEAWERKDLIGLQAELSLSPGGGLPNHSSEEQERMDLLDGIAQQLQQDLTHLSLKSASSQPPEVCFHLLAHLAFSGNHPAIRSRKLAVFPC